MFKLKDDNSSGYFSVRIKGTEVNSEWLLAEADFRLNGFAAQYEFSLLLGELVAFVKELIVFNKTLKGAARFKNIEDNVNIVLSTDGFGHVLIDGTLRDTSYKINLTFSMVTDQTCLCEIINDCRTMVDQKGVAPH